MGQVGGFPGELLSQPTLVLRYCIKIAADDLRNAMAKLEQNVPLTLLRDTFGGKSRLSRSASLGKST